MATFVLSGTELDSKKSQAKSRIANALGSGVKISGDTIEVTYSIDAPKVAQILNEEGVSYSGG
ncbi:hypothetical protein VB715_00550 [Crocosphaera sp. UHCC 0190]|uniref:hypothetical protein n=1 Tax=Crocosphaera sp. UHCC 0190 TaxID=3110246 RepID=UPI002B200D6F|nr:hypothetical protein [Crocosphaera sp. UHCC 0190]MEA5508244.1 hypothetical protein [Crocosphaera sp. UHCC 0190]